MLTPTDLRAYEKTLRGLVDRFRGDVTELQTETRGQAGAFEGGNGLAVAPSGDPDAGRTEEEIDLALLEHEKAQLAECQSALARIEEGTFGRCQDCQRAIPKRRLKAFPYARRCLGCAGLREREAAG